MHFRPAMGEDLSPAKLRAGVESHRRTVRSWSHGGHHAAQIRNWQDLPLEGHLLSHSWDLHSSDRVGSEQVPADCFLPCLSQGPKQLADGLALPSLTELAHLERSRP